MGANGYDAEYPRHDLILEYEFGNEKCTLRNTLKFWMLMEF
jgi:hypothetical protein